MSPAAYNLLIVEDDPDIRQFLYHAIENSPDLNVLPPVGCLRDAKTCMQKKMPDILLVDLGLPDGSGIELIQMARSAKKKAECMVITIHADKLHLMPALEAGAKGYLLKDAMPDDIHRSIMELMQGGSPISPMIARTLLARFETPDTEMVEHLTAGEIKVLKAMTRGLTRKEMAEQLAVSVHTIHAHIKHIYGKLEVNSNVAAIQKVQRLHLIPPEQY